MNSYVEVTAILGTILNGSAWLMSAWLCHRQVPLKKLMLLCPLAPLTACLCWFDGAVWVCAAMELVSVLAVSHLACRRRRLPGACGFWRNSV